MSVGNCSINNRTLYQQDCYSNIGEVSSGYGFINSRNISQCEDSSNFKDMYGGFNKVDVSSGYVSTKIHTVYKHNGFK